MDNIPFNKPYLTGQEVLYLKEVMQNRHFSGDGQLTRFCHRWLEENTRCYKALLTPSCTAALEMAALLLDIKPGDEVILPAYTFVSTANAFVLRGATPVFVDIREDTLNIDESLIEEAITPRTQAIVPVHYAGVACEMETILAIAQRHGLHVIEDAAQGVMAYYQGKALGSLGDLGAYSFHETKNISSGEGGALLINNSKFAQRAEIIREKGTDRSRFCRGEIDKYTWQDVGSSFLPSEMTAAFLRAQLETADQITQMRQIIWQHYHTLLEPLERDGLLRRPQIPPGCQHNAHMYYLLLPAHCDRQMILSELKKRQIQAVSHYVPLHLSPAGKSFGRTHGTLTKTEELSERLIRLPLWPGLSLAQQDYIVESLASIITTVAPAL